jgi:hypothetical protein
MVSRSAGLTAIRSARFFRSASCPRDTFLTDQLFFSVVELLVFAVVGMTFRRLRYPLGPLVLGLVLGPVFEQNVEHMRSLYPGLLWPTRCSWRRPCS